MNNLTDNATRFVLLDIQEERQRQDEKWGEQNHGLAEWIAILGEEFGELCESVNSRNFDGMSTLEEIRKEAIHTAAVAVAMIECIDRKYK